MRIEREKFPNIFSVDNTGFEIPYIEVVLGQWTYTRILKRKVYQAYQFELHSSWILWSYIINALFFFFLVKEFLASFKPNMLFLRQLNGEVFIMFIRYIYVIIFHLYYMWLNFYFSGTHLFRIKKSTSRIGDL